MENKIVYINSLLKTSKIYCTTYFHLKLAIVCRQMGMGCPIV